MLNNKIIFISGGTGYIGEAICRLAASYGAKVIFSWNTNEEKAAKLSNEIADSKAVKINLRNAADIRSKIENLYRENNKIDILVSNAGISQVMPFSMLEEDDLDMMFDINIKGGLLLTKAVVRGMIRHKSGSIVNIGSIAGHRIFDVPVHYAASKAAVAGITLSLVNELKHFNIRVNSVVPGLIEDGVSRGIPKDLRDDFNKHCAAGRAGTGKEVAEAVCFLASDRASYINGQSLSVDGGI